MSSSNKGRQSVRELRCSRWVCPGYCPQVRKASCVISHVRRSPGQLDGCDQISKLTSFSRHLPSCYPSHLTATSFLTTLPFTAVVTSIFSRLGPTQRPGVLTCQPSKGQVWRRRPPCRTAPRSIIIIYGPSPLGFYPRPDNRSRIDTVRTESSCRQLWSERWRTRAVDQRAERASDTTCTVEEPFFGGSTAP